MRLVLGIDAAWTEKNPSGVALVEEIDDGKWKLAAVFSSYGGLCQNANAEGDTIAGNVFDASLILRACEAKAGKLPDLVAVDMPLSKIDIAGARTSDKIVTAEFAKYWCGTHAPSKVRPGEVGRHLYKGFCAQGYTHWVSSGEQEARRLPGLIEVYPHPALLALIPLRERLEKFCDDKRLRYKVSKARKYWNDNKDAPACRQKVSEVWVHIVDALEIKIGGTGDRLGLPPSRETRLKDWKAYEDKLDAVVCAWVAIAALDGRARPFGDDNSAIWVPLPASVS